MPHDSIEFRITVCAFMYGESTLDLLRVWVDKGLVRSRPHLSQVESRSTPGNQTRRFRKAQALALALALPLRAPQHLIGPVRHRGAGCRAPVASAGLREGGRRSQRGRRLRVRAAEESPAGAVGIRNAPPTARVEHDPQRHPRRQRLTRLTTSTPAKPRRAAVVPPFLFPPLPPASAPDRERRRRPGA